MQVRGCNEGASASQYYTPDGLYRIDGTEMGREDFRARTPPRQRPPLTTGEDRLTPSSS